MKPSVLTLLTWDEVQEIYTEVLLTVEALSRPFSESASQDNCKCALRMLRERYDCTAPIAERYEEVLAAAEEAVGVKLNPGRDAVTTTVRSFVAYRLHKEGYSYTDIGRMMGRDHSSVIHLVERKENALSVPGAYKSETEMFNRFNEILGAVSPSS